MRRSATDYDYSCRWECEIEADAPGSQRYIPWYTTLVRVQRRQADVSIVKTL
jgi:hypothetical protein